MTFTGFIGKVCMWPLRAIIRACVALNIHPNTLTLIGVLINVVAACSECNLTKGSKTPQESGMWPTQMPFQPTVHHLHQNGRLFPPNYLHDSWLDYLYWDTELDP